MKKTGISRVSRSYFEFGIENMTLKFQIELHECTLIDHKHKLINETRQQTDNIKYIGNEICTLKMISFGLEFVILVNNGGD